MQSLTDLDAIIGTTYSVRFEGVDYLIPPITTENFIEIQRAIANLEAIKKDEDATLDDAVVLFGKVFSIATNGAMGKEQASRMTALQASVLLASIVDLLVGNTKKKETKRRK